MDRVGDAGVDRGWPGRVRDRYCQRDRSGPQCGRSASEQGNPVPVSVDADKPASHDLAASNRRVLEQVNGRPRAVAQCGARRAVRPGAGVGVMYGRWTTARPLELRGPWISNVCTDLQRVYPTLTAVGRCAGAVHPGAGVGAPWPGAGVGVMYGRWTTARPLELRGPWISNVCTDLQRVYPTLTAVGRCAGAVHPGAGIGVKAAVEATTPRKTEFHASEGDRQAVETPRFLNHEPGGQPRTHVSQKPPCLSWQARKPVTFADPRPAPLAWDGGSRSDPGLDPCLFRESP